MDILLKQVEAWRQDNKMNSSMQTKVSSDYKFVQTMNKLHTLENSLPASMPSNELPPLM